MGCLLFQLPPSFRSLLSHWRRPFFSRSGRNSFALLRQAYARMGFVLPIDAMWSLNSRYALIAWPSPPPTATDYRQLCATPARPNRPFFWRPSYRPVPPPFCAKLRSFYFASRSGSVFRFSRTTSLAGLAPTDDQFRLPPSPCGNTHRPLRPRFNSSGIRSKPRKPKH